VEHASRRHAPAMQRCLNGSAVRASSRLRGKHGLTRFRGNQQPDTGDIAIHLHSLHGPVEEYRCMACPTPSCAERDKGCEFGALNTPNIPDVWEPGVEKRTTCAHLVPTRQQHKTPPPAPHNPPPSAPNPSRARLIKHWIQCEALHGAFKQHSH
jgi:hypothetical protein